MLARMPASAAQLSFRHSWRTACAAKLRLASRGAVTRQRKNRGFPCDWRAWRGFRRASVRSRHATPMRRACARRCDTEMGSAFSAGGCACANRGYVCLSGGGTSSGWSLASGVRLGRDPLASPKDLDPKKSLACVTPKRERVPASVPRRTSPDDQRRERVGPVHGPNRCRRRP